MTQLPQIAIVNEVFRTTMIQTPTRKIAFSELVADLSESVREELLTKIRNFKDWNAENDPYNERDFGSVMLHGKKYYFKIDYYDKDFQYGEDPVQNPSCNRLMTIMRAEEY